MNKFGSGSGSAWLLPVLSASLLSALLTAVILYLLLVGSFSDAVYKQNSMMLDHIEYLINATGSSDSAFRHTPHHSDMRFIALDLQSGVVTTSTHQFYVGKNSEKLNMDIEPFRNGSENFIAVIHGERLYVTTRTIKGETIAALTIESRVSTEAIPMTLFISLLVFGLTFVTGFLLTTVAVKYSDEHKVARTDAPTKLLNRRAYAEDIQKLKASRRLEKLRYVSLDLNGLKEANDTLGHEAGDELIKNTARFMMTAFGHLGKLYRTGGDEFVALLMCDRANYEEALDIFNEGVELWKSVRGRPFSVSVGEASKEEFPDFSIDELAKCADKRMYEAKDEYYRKTGKTRRK